MIQQKTGHEQWASDYQARERQLHRQRIFRGLKNAAIIIAYILLMFMILIGFLALAPTHN